MRWIALIYPPHHPQADGVVTLCKRINSQVYAHSDQHATWSSAQQIELRHQGVLLELQSSERLFGGATQLLTQLWQSVDSLGAAEPTQGIHMHQAPSALGAWALCKCRPAGSLDELLRRGQHTHAAQFRQLQGLPLNALDLSPREQHMLKQFGFETIQDLLRQRRDDLAHRLGPSLLKQLDGILGQHPWMGRALADAETFCAHQELPFHCHDQHRIEKLAQRLLEALDLWLKVRKLKTWALHFRFFQAHQVIPLSIQSARGVQSSAEGLLLLHHQLTHMTFTDDIRSIELQSRDFAPATDHNASLLPDPNQSSQQWLTLCDLLSARLGHDSIQYMHPHEDPRADRGFELQTQVGGMPPKSARPKGFVPRKRQHARLPELAVRPLWLLSEPLKLKGPEPSWREQSGSEWWLLSGPERIDFGWWEQEAQRRDYYRALHRNRSQAWLFCEEENTGGKIFRSWYIHGYFA